MVALKATDRDGDRLLFHASAVAANGSDLPVDFRVDGNYLAISPKADLTGKVVFDVTVSDGKQLANRRFVVDVIAPVAEKPHLTSKPSPTTVATSRSNDQGTEPRAVAGTETIFYK